jgi:hypothetical protein
LEIRYDDLAHAEHRLGRRYRTRRTGIVEQLKEPLRHDLPTQPIAVLQPATLRFLAAVGQALPVIIDLVLVLAVDGERDRLGERKLRPPLMAMKRAPSSTKVPDITAPDCPGPASVYRLSPSMCEFGNTVV